jgi:HEAT repeat protein
MDFIKLQKKYKYARDTEHLSEEVQVDRSMDFIEMLMSDNSTEAIDYHYGLLKQRDYKSLYYDIRAAFEERPEAESFLINKLSTETDPVALGDILHLLGLLKSAHAINLAQQYADSNSEYQREVALYVLGWVGEETDIEILNRHLLTEESSHLRITAASAHRQIHFRLPELKSPLLASLKQGFENEKDDEVIAWIIVMIESIALKRLGLREDKEDPDIIHGDVQKAKIKAAKFLAELDLS